MWATTSILIDSRPERGEHRRRLPLGVEQLHRHDLGFAAAPSLPVLDGRRPRRRDGSPPCRRRRLQRQGRASPADPSRSRRLSHRAAAPGPVAWLTNTIVRPSWRNSSIFSAQRRWNDASPTDSTSSIEQDLGFDVGRDGESEAHRHPRGVVLDRRVDELLESGERHDVVEAAGDLLARHPEDRPVEVDVLTCRSARRGTRHRARGGRTAARRRTSRPCRGQDPGQALQQRALARAIRADDAERGAVRDVEARRP